MTAPAPTAVLVRPELGSRGAERVLSGLSAAQVRVLDAVRGHPGAVVSELAEVLECSNTNVTRHLDRLRRLGVLVREKHGRGVRHYCSLDDPVGPRLAAYCQDEKKRRVLELLAAHPGRQWIANEIACYLGLQHAFVQRLLKRLANQALVDIHKPTSRYYVRATPELIQAMASRTNHDNRDPKEEAVATDGSGRALG